VEVAGAGGPLPLAGREGLMRFGLVIDGQPQPPDRSDRAYLRWATPGYFEAMGIPLRAGRLFAARDMPGAPLVAVVDEVLAARFFPGRDPIGSRLRTTNDQNWRTIVGIVGHVHQTSLERDPAPHVYVPEAQMPSPALTLVVRGTADAKGLTSGIRSVVRQIDAGLPLSNVRTLSDLVAGSTASRRSSTLLLTLFAAVAMGLTLIGVYGVVAQRVSESTRELGIRLALGARSTSVMRHVLRTTLGITAAGVLGGAAAAWLAAPVLAGMLYGVGARDVSTMIVAATLVLAAALLAAYLPARRVLRLDVINALRIE
jgi:predicted permease